MISAFGVEHAGVAKSDARRNTAYGVSGVAGAGAGVQGVRAARHYGAARGRARASSTFARMAAHSNDEAARRVDEVGTIYRAHRGQPDTPDWHAEQNRATDLMGEAVGHAAEGEAHAKLAAKNAKKAVKLRARSGRLGLAAAGLGAASVGSAALAHRQKAGPK